MNPLAWLIGLVFPACGFPAAGGLPTPPLMDISHIVRPASPNSALAAPAGFTPPPDVVTQPYPLQADALFAIVRTIAAAQPRTYQAALYAGPLQVDYVARSAVFNFPDLIMAQVQKDGPDRSNVIIYSRSVYGESDFGVNHKRLGIWLAAIQAKLPPPSKR